MRERQKEKKVKKEKHKKHHKHKEEKDKKHKKERDKDKKIIDLDGEEKSIVPFQFKDKGSSSLLALYQRQIAAKSKKKNLNLDTSGQIQLSQKIG